MKTEAVFDISPDTDEIITLENFMNTKKAYLLVASKPWIVDEFYAARKRLPGRWAILSSPDDLSASFLKDLSPRYIFFSHWSQIVPRQILDMAECVCFHMTDLPYGRGGSPLQNLILDGKTETKISAFRMEQGIDSGPVYQKAALSLAGSAEEIFRRAAVETMNLIEKIVLDEPEPRPQKGKATFFRRRAPEESELAESMSLGEIYDYIRALDAPGYPHAFLNFGDKTVTFTKARLCADGVQATAKITGKSG